MNNIIQWNCCDQRDNFNDYRLVCDNYNPIVCCLTKNCRTSYVCGLNDQCKDMYEDYQRRFAEDPFNEDTVRVGDAPLDEISEAQRSKWKEMIESTDFTHSSRKAWKTINKLTKDYTEPQQ